MKTTKLVIIIAILVAAGFGGYHLYHYVMNDIQKRIRSSVRAGVGQGVIDTINPIKHIDKAFGGKK